MWIPARKAASERPHCSPNTLDTSGPPQWFRKSPELKTGSQLLGSVDAIYCISQISLSPGTLVSDNLRSFGSCSFCLGLSAHSGHCPSNSKTFLVIRCFGKIIIIFPGDKTIRCIPRPWVVMTPPWPSSSSPSLQKHDQHSTDGLICITCSRGWGKLPRGF